MSRWVLMLDDLRDYKLVKIPEKYDDCERVLVRSYFEFVDIIKKRGVPEAVFLDHDLGPESMDEGIQKRYQSFDYKAIKGEKTGLHAAKFLVEHCQENELKLPVCYCHSQNPVGRENILKYLKNHEPKKCQE